MKIVNTCHIFNVQVLLILVLYQVSNNDSKRVLGIRIDTDCMGGSSRDGHLNGYDVC